MKILYYKGMKQSKKHNEDVANALLKAMGNIFGNPTKDRTNIYTEDK